MAKLCPKFQFGLLEEEEGGKIRHESRGYEMSNPVLCPDCENKAVWNGTQYICIACPWTEHKMRPPSSSSLLPPILPKSKKPKDKK